MLKLRKTECWQQICIVRAGNTTPQSTNPDIPVNRRKQYNHKLLTHALRSMGMIRFDRRVL